MDKEKRFDNIKPGSEFKGHIIKKVYFFDANKNYIIFENENNDVIYYAERQLTDISMLLGQCNLMREMTNDEKFREWINTQKACALSEFLCGNDEKSVEVLETCIKTAENREKAKKKMVYIGTYLTVVVSLLLFMALLSACPHQENFMRCVSVIVFGAFGGFISLNTRLEKIDFNVYEGMGSYILVSVYKLAFACISSIVVYYLIESDMILSAMKDSKGIIYVAATLAGFSESLLPNIFSGIEKDIIDKKEQKVIGTI